MSDGTLKVLVVEEDEGDYLIIRDALALAPDAHYEVTRVLTCEAASAALRSGEHDACLLAYCPLEAAQLELLRASSREVAAAPIVALYRGGGDGGGEDEKALEFAVTAAGAMEVLKKGEIVPLVLSRTIRFAIRNKALAREFRRHTEVLSAKNRELYRMQRELEEKNRELTRLNEEKNGFIGMAAHDLRNPLGVILGYSDFLLIMRQDHIEEEDVEIIEQVGKSSRFMLSLINDLLNISTIEAGKLTLDRASTDLGKLAVENVRWSMLLAARKGIRLVCAVDKDLPLVSVDPHKVEQVLNNLIGNAVQYSYPESSIEIAVRRQRGEVVISVADHGQGIAAADMDKLFRPFGRGSSVSTGGEKSTGLGLAIARRIVEGHGGRIWVESEIGKGSTFFAAFPLRTEGAALSAIRPS